MSGGVGPAQQPAIGAGTGTRRHRWFPFWIMQATEIVIALVFADISVHVTNGGLLIGAAIALFALAVTAQGPLGLFRVCGQRLHLWLAMAVSVAMALAPLIPALRPDIEGIIVLEFGAVGLFRVATLTRTGEPYGAVRAGGHGRSSVIDANATVTDAAGGAGAGTGARAGAGAGAGAGVGGAAAGAGADASAGGRATGSPTSSGAAARWAGRASGAAVASGKQVVADYRPEAEAQVKRTIRGVGRLAGRMSSRITPPDDPTR
jgi:hypothetical protein